MRALTKCFNYYRDWFLLPFSSRLARFFCVPLSLYVRRRAAVARPMPRISCSTAATAAAARSVGVAQGDDAFSFAVRFQYSTQFQPNKRRPIRSGSAFAVRRLATMKWTLYMYTFIRRNPLCVFAECVRPIVSICIELSTISNAAEGSIQDTGTSQ